jgi:hypothetical protein
MVVHDSPVFLSYIFHWQASCGRTLSRITLAAHYKLKDRRDLFCEVKVQAIAPGRDGMIGIRFIQEQ